MRQFKIITTTALLLGLIVGCARGDQEKYGDDAMSAPTMSEAEPSAAGGGYMAEESESYANADGDIATDSISSIMSSSAAVSSAVTDTSYQFIRTADARFRVKNVRQATFAVEKIVAHFGGYVAHTALESTIDNEKRTPISDDSTLITTYYTVRNNLVLRVPADNLDSTLRTMGQLAQYLDYRRIDRENATFMVLRERLAARRINRTTTRLEDAVDETQAKLRDRAAIEEALFNKQTMADESYIRTLELKDQIQLSTITLQLYQRQDWVHEMVANEKNVDAYKPGFWSQAGESIGAGWDALKMLVLGIMRVWPFLLLILGIVATIWMIQRRRKK
jgi:hypothetical protein